MAIIVMTTSSIDLSFRPETYFPSSPNREQLLSNITGQARRDLAAHKLEEEGFQSLTEFLARPELNDDQRKEWGRVHPAMMGGEYLPGFTPEEAEIARISLKSTTFDQISIRALDIGDYIQLSVVDEYDTDFKLDFSKISKPLSLGGLILFLDNSGHEEFHDGGLITSHWNSMASYDYPHTECVDFATVDSAYYPELKRYYKEFSEKWISDRKKRKERMEDLEAKNALNEIHLT
jgi:hypothetical protein